jgi:TRAP-type uncharacterized transport system fused permease subunit
MLAGIILGMGMPTTPAYIVMVSLLVPAIIKLGAIAPAAHMFAFYFAILSAITPPVALAVYAAAGLAKAQPVGGRMDRGARRRRRLHRAVHVHLRALAADDRQPGRKSCRPRHRGIDRHRLPGLRPLRHFVRNTLMWERIALVTAAVLLIKPGLVTDLTGGGLLVVVLASQFLLGRRASTT